MIKSFVVLLGLFALLGCSVALPASASSLDIGGRRIVNGTSTTIEQIPFQVSILFFGSQWCGASILDETTLLTAAHCFDWYFDGLYAITAWSARAGSSFWATGGSVVEFASITKHPQYDPTTFNLDIAIVKLTTRLVFSPAVRPVKLPLAASTVEAGQPVQVSGWGRLTVSG